MSDDTKNGQPPRRTQAEQARLVEQAMKTPGVRGAVEAYGRGAPHLPAVGRAAPKFTNATGGNAP